ncbi:hypothetical protein DVA86_15290 [Streptomyces armeniacus]|uniref:DUF3040 domain-containing protein n=1 Tax=Streptomyces armeniacus TaxID=83291 RepID=A0A345XQA3_9ACTN|nr:hypothetical protein [Streptomyces armeniacus]AXK33819.1 hypothetical protein DVA86_15290 [Streptomyces armeniacus]
MSAPDRKEDEVRRMLELRPAPLPVDLAARALVRGERQLRRHNTWRAVLWTVLLVAAIAFTVWALAAEPWVARPSQTTPPSYDW